MSCWSAWRIPTPATTESAPVKGPIKERFPLLDRCLAGAPEEIRAERRNRFARVAAHLEFPLWVQTSDAGSIATEAVARKFATWMTSGEAVTHLYGAGEVPGLQREATLDWLQ
ncbi:MAG: hypothetical protein ACLQGV_06835 [Bryobacteraceae bacterium]